METSVVNSKGQITIPKTIRRKLGIKQGSKIAFIEQNDGIYIRSLDKNYFESLAGIVGTNGKMLKSLMKSKKKEREL
jgi:AbrB family looped-hinge helix DNA binding protein